MTEDVITLDNLCVGQKARVVFIDNEEPIKRRLLDIGLIINSEIKCVLKSPFGDPKAYLICGAVIAIRREDASKIGIVTVRGE